MAPRDKTQGTSNMTQQTLLQKFKKFFKGRQVSTDGHHVFDLAHYGDIISSKPPKISVPDNFCIRFSPQFQTRLSKVLKSHDDNDAHEIFTVFDRIGQFCTEACGTEQFLLVRICSDQWLRSKIIWKYPQPVSMDIEQVPPDQDGDSYTMAVQSNILPRQESLERLEKSSLGTSHHAKWLPWRLFVDIAGTDTRSFPKGIANGKHKYTSCELTERLKREQRSRPASELQDLGIGLPVIPAVPEFHKILSKAKGASQVWEVTISQGVYAMKQFHALESLCAEVKFVQLLSHPHIVHTFGCTELHDPEAARNDQLNFLLMECMEDNLNDWITKRSNQRPFKRLDSLDVLLQVAEAMAYLHRKMVVHGDLKSPNILISQFNISGGAKEFITVVKLADFGSAQDVNSNNECSFEPSKGTTRWAAPEVLQSSRPPKGKQVEEKDKYLKNPFKIDVYSFGLIAYEVLTGLMPFQNSLPDAKFIREIVGKDLSLSTAFTTNENIKIYPNSFITFMQKCWAYEPTDRPSFDQISDTIRNAKSSKNVFNWNRRQELSPSCESKRSPEVKATKRKRDDGPEQAKGNKKGR